jgi:exodeoxyribonuclease V beta subunit
VGETRRGFVAEFNALEIASPLQGNVFIEASAGTGKTFAIEHIVVHLLKQNIPLDQILLTTFTNKGVRDLKRRIHLRLLQEQKESPSLSVKNGLRLIDQAEIHTIHSFCYKMQKEYAFEAGYPIDLAQDSEGGGTKIEDLILDTLRTSISEEEFSPNQLLQLLRPFGKSIVKYVKKMVSFLGTNPTLPEIPSFHILEKRLLALLSEDELLSLPLFYKKMASLKLSLDLESLIRFAPNLYELLNEENLKKGAEVPATLLPKVEELRSLMKEAAHPTFLFFRMAKKVQEKEDPDEVTEHRLLETMARAVLRKEFREAVSLRYQAVIIDEFQDTDRLQWQILESLYYNKASLFLVVGDPKQSIYAFRGGDLPTFLEAKKSFEKIYSLSTNYRSPASLLEPLNRLFAKKSLFGDISYLPLKSGKGEILPTSGLFFFLFPSYDEELLFSFLASEILRLKKEENLAYEAFAILLKDRYQIERLSTFFKKEGIPVLSLQQKPITTVEMFSLFEIVFKILYKNRDFNLLKQFALHPLIGWERELILTFPDSPKALSLITSFEELSSTFHKEGLIPFLIAFLAIYRPYLAGTLESKNDLDKILSLLLDSPLTPTPEFFEEARKSEERGDSSLLSFPLMKKGAVQVLTTHMSKGLEFDYVFALGVSTRGSYTELLSSAETLDEEKARLFYVALTRAKKRMSLLLPLELKPADEGCASPSEIILQKQIKEPLTRESIEACLDSLELEHTFIDKKMEILVPGEALESLFLEKEEKLHALSLEDEIYSFSKIAPHSTLKLEASLEDPLPKGAEVGVLLHALLEKWVEEGIYFFTPLTDWPAKIKDFLYTTPLEGKEEEVFSLLYAAFHTPLGDFSLKDIHPSDMLQEVPFTYRLSPTSLMKGFADLIFSREDGLYLIDWKFHSLPNYTEEMLSRVMDESHYHTQRAIYEEALSRYFPTLPIKNSFYFFLRGKERGVFRCH